MSRSSSPNRDTGRIDSSPQYDSNNTNFDSTMRDSNPIPSSPAGPANVPSSPLFFPPSSDNDRPHTPRDHPRSSASARSRATRMSSPVHFSSSLGEESSARKRNPQRGEINATDFSSSPMRRRFFSQQNDNRSSGDRSSSIANLGSDTSDAVDSEEPVRVIWGTNVSIDECTNSFRSFLLSFKMKYRKILDDSSIEEEDERNYYVEKLNQMREMGTSNLNLDVINLLAYSFTKKLYYQLIHYPQEVIPIMDQTIKDCMINLILEDNNGDEQDPEVARIDTTIYKIRPYNLQDNKGMRELNPNDIDKLVSVKGLVIRSTPIIPDMKIAFFKCTVCDHTMEVENDRGVIQEPTKCPREVCAQANSMQLIHNRSTFADKQVIKLQETPDLVPDGQTPHSVSLCVYDELVDTVRAGDRVEVCGIFRSVPVRTNAIQRTVKALFKTYLDVVHIKKVDRKRMAADISTLENEVSEQQEVEEVKKLSEEDIEMIHQISERPDLYEVLSRSLAPSIYEMDDVKKGILLQLFGGTNKEFEKGGRYRGDINVLLVGDPSTSKSQMLQYVHKIAPRGIYTSGKGSSAVGLTAYITRDVDTRQFVLESGALVLSDGGICCIDEFDKMSDSTRSVLHEVMEQQTISIAKAGIITTLNARTSILASANPVNSRFDVNLPVVQNIDLPPPLLSRFDLVYLILDKVDEKADRLLAQHMTQMYLEDTPENVSEYEILPIHILTSYIQYAKENFTPVMTEEGKVELVRAYVEMRMLGDDPRSSEKRITATTRQLESMIRLSEAHAKMRLSETVDLQDVRESVRLMKAAIKNYATDPKTGKIDMTMVMAGPTPVET
ncbi:Mcm2-7 hexameric complex component [Komagataella phaffii CBS 7435]|uniref:DNA replication licensing factor MCM4 n=2 Tax=Komagataella phaffii TaxID=460519 RepID=C4QXJ7_KOMPG|nr:uncharacterized protein PAS_chr1-4_0142 [Komagataella phaffii GS115]AOA60947.1 GQ67_02045T0 [Komagataella phaffii]CAH2446784.1 Mcm2-7 hexameric complex component [Komagataella phaffii CBS 7435]AOA66776.1 GQ68_02060T0 [Komagataella phaffii GS115]CAY67970.1 Essential helicase component of heterohexameric MCM2-7 complexes [Komagataella phaffii GS115]CCA37044.1 Mcm2-7 hexameric complex component [Komagataella phaffii CBS 7435]